jgi:uncharacterized protein YbcV (DUF1398 family)
MNTNVLDECLALNFQGKLPFPETLARLATEGVQWYSANFILGRKTWYSTDDQAHGQAFPDWKGPAVAPAFSQDGIVAAIRASQRGEIIFPEFIERAMAAGVAYYTVHLQGRKAIYFSRDGEFHIEEFPPL